MAARGAQAHDSARVPWQREGRARAGDMSVAMTVAKEGMGEGKLRQTLVRCEEEHGG